MKSLNHYGPAWLQKLWASSDNTDTFLGQLTERPVADIHAAMKATLIAEHGWTEERWNSAVVERDRDMKAIG